MNVHRVAHVFGARRHDSTRPEVTRDLILGQTPCSKSSQQHHVGARALSFLVICSMYSFERETAPNMNQYSPTPRRDTPHRGSKKVAKFDYPARGTYTYIAALNERQIMVI